MFDCRVQALRLHVPHDLPEKILPLDDDPRPDRDMTAQASGAVTGSRWGVPAGGGHGLKA